MSDTFIAAAEEVRVDVDGIGREPEKALQNLLNNARAAVPEGAVVVYFKHGKVVPRDSYDHSADAHIHKTIDVWEVSAQLIYKVRRND